MLQTHLKKNKHRRKRKFKNIDEKIADCLDPRFNDRESASIKSFAVKKRSEIKVTTRCMSGKLLMFAKLSLKSFIYEIADIFCFPDENIEEIYKKYMIERVKIFHVLTNTDSTSLKFMFISDLSSEVTEDKFKDIIFEVIIASKIYTRFDSSQKFQDIFGTRKENKRKTVGYYEIENIDNPWQLTQKSTLNY